MSIRIVRVCRTALGLGVVFLRPQPSAQAMEASPSQPRFESQLEQGGRPIQAAAARLEKKKDNELLWSNYFPRSIIQERDGGTLVMEGNLSKTVEAVVRYDGRFNSPTRGRFFATKRVFNQPAQPERAMTRTELEALSRAVERHLMTPGLGDDKPVYERFLSRLRAFLAQ